MFIKLGFISVIIIYSLCLIVFCIMIYREKHNKIKKVNCYNCVYNKFYKKNSTGTIVLHKCHKLGSYMLVKPEENDKFIKCNFFKSKEDVHYVR